MIHRTGAALAAAFVVVTALCASTASASTQVTDPFTVGYVWNDRTSQPGCYTPTPYYSYNSRTAINSICRTGIGSYVVHLPMLASPGGNAQATAYGGTPANCKVSYWVPSGTEELIGVNCYSFSGTPQDATFTASFTAGGGSANTIAFAWANNPTAGFYTPSSTYQYNNRGGLATISRTGVGAYTVAFPNSSGARAAGGVKITSYGSGSGVCKVVSWGPNTVATAQLVNVQCYNSAGSVSDQMFSIVYVDGMNILGDNLMADGYAWVTSHRRSRTHRHWPTSAAPR